MVADMGILSAVLLLAGNRVSHMPPGLELLCQLGTVVTYTVVWVSARKGDTAERTRQSRAMQ